jgi:ligand-binding sensor domain-containing protein/signal transduction histidine kinase
LKKAALNQKQLHCSKLLCQCAILVCFFAFVSCNHQTSSTSQNDTAKKLQPINTTRKDSFVVPKVTYITAGNQPKILKAGKPVIRIDSSNGGAPFFTNYSTEQGLPLNSVFCSATDQAGNLWFGTIGGGVSKYDGKTFTNYTIAQGLVGNVVFSIVEDKAGNLWFGTSSGVSKYDGYRFTSFTTSEGLAGNFVSSLMQDSWGNLWVGSQGGGASKYDGQHFTNYTTAQGLASNDVRCMIQDKSGNIWFGTAAGGLSKYDGKTFTNYTTAQGLGNNSVNRIAQDKAGNFWFGTNAGVSKYDGNKFTNYTTMDGLAGNAVSCIVQDKAGNLWFGTYANGISKYDGSKFTNYTKKQGLAENNITNILKDKAGNLWFTSYGGVIKYEGNGLTSYTTAHGLASNMVFTILQDNGGNLWFCTYDGGVSRYNGKSFTNYTAAQGLADNRVWNMLEDRAGNIWFATDKGGASKFDGKRFTNYTSEQGLASNGISCIAQDKAGNIWFGTSEGASKYDGKSFTNYTTAQGLVGNNVMRIVQDKAGNLWFATHDDGVSKYDGNQFTKYTTAQGLVSNKVYNLISDKAENIWVGTNAGVSKYDGKSFTNYTTEQGLSDNYIWAMVEDKQRDMIWFGTNQGLSGLKENSSTTGNPRQNVFENFTKNTGYPIKGVGAGALLVDNKGILWVGSGQNELIRFDYAAVNKNTVAFNLKIQTVKVNNEPVCWNNLLRKQQVNKTDSLTILNEMITSFGKVLSPAILDSMAQKYGDIQLGGVTPFYPVPINLVLPYKDNSITIDFVAIEPALQKQVKYQYKLEGYSKDWSPLSNNSAAVFGNMKAGDYNFKLRAVSPFGVWSETTYPFKVLPPWWATWWAYGFYALLAGGVGYTLYRNHIQSLKSKQAEKIKAIVATQEEERKRISKDLHDDIGARLTNINILSALCQQKINEPQEASDYLKRISSEIQTSAEALDDIVWSMDGKNDLMEEVTARMRRYASDVFDRTAIRYSLQADETYLPAKLSMGKRRDLFFVFKEAITNIQKHAMATEVIINITEKDNNLLMQVADNGSGFDVAMPTHRNGLKNMQQRMQKWNGTCTVQSSPGKGTLLKIMLPVSASSLKGGIWAWFKSR